MGVEPTVACSVQPTTSFEDWGTHRGTTTPTISLAQFEKFGYRVLSPGNSTQAVRP